MKQCRYRKQSYECEHDDTFPCSICIQGQQADTLELQTSAIANLTACLQEESISRKIRDAVKDATYQDINPIFEGE